MRENTYQHLYGPVPSRRLGRSLGVDIVPYKVCSFDCIYCQLGRTTELTCVPRRMAEKQGVMPELKKWLSAGNDADYITFAGSGEPTLNLDLREMIRETLCITDLPVAVITNGSLLSNPDVRSAVMDADVLLPSLDFGTEEAFQKVNRPCRELGLTMVVDGLIRARHECHGELWLEVMLVSGLNDTETELHALAEIIERIDPDRVQINTVERPSRSGEVSAVDQDTIEKAMRMFGAHAEIITSHPISADSSLHDEPAREFILSLLSRRPCTLSHISSAAGIHVYEAAKHLRKLVSDGLIATAGPPADPYYSTTGICEEASKTQKIDTEPRRGSKGRDMP